MQSDNQAKYKSSALKSMMNNPKLSKILQDGLASSIGSTKRAQAKAVFSVLKKLRGDNSSGYSIPKVKEVKDAYTILRDYMRNDQSKRDGRGGVATTPATTTPAVAPTTAPATTPAPASTSTTPALAQRAPTPTNPNFTGNTPPAWATTGENTGWLGDYRRWKARTARTVTKGLSTILPAAATVAEEGVRQASWLPYLFFGDIAKPLGMDTSKNVNAGILEKTLAWNPNASTDRPATGTTPATTPATGATTGATPGATPATQTTGGTNPTDVTYKEKDFADYGDKGIVISTGPDSWFFYSNDKFSRGKVGDTEKQATLGVATDNPEFIDNTGKNTGMRNYDTGTLYATSANTWLWVGDDGEIKKGTNKDDGQVVRSAGATAGTTAGATAGVTGEPSISAEEGIYDTATVDNLFAGTNFEETWNNLPASQKTALLPMIEMVNANYGPNMAAMMIQSDHEKMKALFPGVPDDQLPWGASYMRQVDELSDRLKEEYKLNLLTNEKANLAKSGETLVQDLTKYIKGKDTYIENVNGMIDKVKENMLQSSGIAGNQINNQYLNYLNVLKGRQNSRYTTLINDAATRHDAMMTDLDNEITNRTAQYREDLANQTEMKKTDYENMRATLANMYTSLASAPTNALTIEKAKIDNMNGLSEIVKKSIASGTSGKTPLEEVDAYKKNFITTDSDGAVTIIPETDLNYRIPLILNGTGYSAANLTRFLADAFHSSYGSATSLDSLQSGIKIIDNYDESSSTDVAGNVLVPKAVLYQSFLTPIYNIVKKNVTDNSANIRKALKTLVKKGSDKLSRDEFVSDYIGDIRDEALLKAIWDSYVEAMSQPGVNAQDIFGDLNAISDEELINKIAGNVQYSLIPI